MKWQKEKEKGKKNVLVLHLGITDFNKFAAEIDSPEMLRRFDYYAMSHDHYHDHKEKRFDCLGGLLAYSGSLDLYPSEGNGNVFYIFFTIIIKVYQTNLCSYPPVILQNLLYLFIRVT